VLEENKYELCATFQSSNKDEGSKDDYYRPYNDKTWQHDAGYQCLERKVMLPKVMEDVEIIR